MRAFDPDCQCQKYFSRGPNRAWHIDGFDKLKPYGFPKHGCIDRYSWGILVLTKVRNDLWQARNDLKQSTTIKTQPTMTWTYLQQAKKRRETTNNKQIFWLFYNMRQKVLFSNTFSTQHLVVFIWALLHGENEAMLHGENRVSSIYYHSSGVNYHVYFLWDIRFIFFCLGFVSGKGRGYYFSSSPLPPASQIVQSTVFAFIREV